MNNALKIEFPFAYPSGCKYAIRNGWKIRMGWNQKTDRFLKNYHLVKKYNAKEKRTVHIERYSPKRNFIKDDENLRFGHKPLKDALVRAKLLVDDSMNWLKDTYEQKVGVPKTVVTISWRRI